MRILSVRFLNFRSLRDVGIPLRQQTILVGPNNVGKTSVLEGLEGALGVGRRSYAFNEDDVSVGVDKADGFEIWVTFGPSTGDTFSDDETATFDGDIDPADGHDRLYVVVAGKAEEDGVFRTRIRFAKSDGVPYGYVPEHERRALGVLLLPAVREARREFAERGGLWARLGAQSEVSGEGQARLAGLSGELGEAVVSEVLGSETADAVSQRIRSLVSSVLYGSQSEAAVSYGAVPIDPAQALRQIEVRLATPDDSASRRVGDHSVGTQSVAMFGLFGAYAEKLGGQIVALAIEEPEAHLHPHAVRALVGSVRALDSQVILTTHSTAVTDTADPRSIVRLRRTPQGTVAHVAAGSGLEDVDVRWIRRTAAEVGSDFLFARVVLLSEGESEHLALPEFARQLAADFDVLGITVVPVHGSRFGGFSRLLGSNGLNIPCAWLCDRDKASGFIRELVKDGLLHPETDPRDPDAARPEAASQGRFWWSAGDFEQCLMADGGTPLYVDALTELYGPKVFERYVAGARIPLPANPSDPEFLHRVLAAKSISKPLVNQRVAELFGERSVEVPDEVRALVGYVAGLAATEAVSGVPASGGAGSDGPTGLDSLPGSEAPV